MQRRLDPPHPRKGTCRMCDEPARANDSIQPEISSELTLFQRHHVTFASYFRSKPALHCSCGFMCVGSSRIVAGGVSVPAWETAGAAFDEHLAKERVGQ